MNRLFAALTLGIFMAGLTPAVVWAEPGRAAVPPVPAEPQTAAAPSKAALSGADRQTASPAQAEVPEPVPVVLAKVETRVTPEAGGTLNLGAMTVEIPAGAVDSAVTVSVEELGSVQTMNPGMQNATARVAGYRLLPHRTFSGWVKLSLPYDKALADTPAAREALEAYFYDEEAKVWTKIRKTGVDEQKGVVEGVTSHFTDFITGTLKLPDSPKPLGFNPTSIKDIKAADPGAGVPEIKGLEPGNTGSASFQLPLRLPSGRAGMAPELALSYDSGIKSGWLGVGFDVSAPAIRIDTRFGVPNFDGADLYSFAGQDLTKVSDTGGVATFVPRIEAAFSRITRLPGTGHQYQWVVAEKNGKKSYYGSTADSTGGPTPAHDYVWYLSRQEDPNGNWVQWTYTKDDGHIYPASIVYTGHESDAGAYRIVFENETRNDRRGDARGSYLDKIDQRLKDIQMFYTGGSSPTLIRKSVFEYGTTTFGKSILTAYHEEDGSGAVFYRYTFDHYSLPTDAATGKIYALSDPKLWDGGTGKGDFDSSFSTDSSGGANFYAGLRVIPGGQFSAGINATFADSSSYENSRLVGLKGDGIPDLITHNMKSRNIAGGLYGGGFSDVTLTGDQDVWKLVDESTSDDNRTDVGYYASAGGFGASLSGSYANSWQTTTSNWTFIDIDGDGLTDIVGPSDYYFKNTSSGGKVSFTKTYYGASTVVAGTPTLDPEIAKRYHLLDPIRLWAAWRDGTVDVTSNTSVTGAATGWDGVTSSLYLNGTKNQSAALSANGSKTLSLAGKSVTQGDRVSFRLNSNYYVANDMVDWKQTVRYKTIRLFSDKTNLRYPIYPGSLPDPLPSGTITSGDWRTGVKSYNISSVLNAVYLRQSNYDPNSNTTTYYWTPKGTSSDANAVLSALGYCVYQSLTVNEYTVFGKQVTSDGDGKTVTGNGLSSYYNYNPVTGMMELTSAAASSDVALAAIYSLMVSINGFGGHSDNQEFSSGVTGLLDKTTGKLISSQNKTVTISMGAGLGQWDSANKRFWVETDADAAGSATRVWLGPYQDSAQVWHVSVHTEGAVSFDGTDTWYDGTALTVTPQTRSSDSQTYLKIGVNSSGQTHEIDAFYSLPSSLDRATVYGLWGNQTVTPLMDSVMTSAVTGLGSTEGAWFKSKFVFGVSQYGLVSGLGANESNFVSVSESLANIVPVSGVLSPAQWTTMQTALGGLAAQYAQSSYTLNAGTWTLNGNLSPAQTGFLLIVEQIAGVVSGTATAPAPSMDAATMTSLVSAVTANAWTHFAADFTPQTAWLLGSVTASEAEEVFWDEGVAGLLPDFGMTASTTQGIWIKEISPPASFAQTVAAANLFSYAQAIDWLDFDSQTLFPVMAVTAPSSVNEYQWGTRSAAGTTDAVVIGVFDANGTIVATPVYVHPFDSETDTTSYDIFSTPPLSDSGTTAGMASNNVLQTFAGGGYSWFYAEWDGSQEYSEAMIQNQLAVMQDTSDSASNDTRVNAQVIWKMQWGVTGTPYAGVWHGAVTTQQTTSWDASSKSMQTVTSYGYSSIGATQSQPYRVGGDSALQTASTADLASGGGLSWVRKSSGQSTTYSAGGGVAGLGGNVTYSTGSSSGGYDLMDMNGDGLPDLVRSNGNVYLNTGNGFSSTAVNWGNGSLRNFSNVGLSLSGSGSASSQVMSMTLNNKGSMVCVVPAPGSSSSASTSIGAGFSIGASYKTNDLIDMLGDGLPDMVSSSGSALNVRANTGSGFGPSLSFAVPSAVQNYLDQEIQNRFKNAGIGGSVIKTLAFSSSSARTSLLGFSGSTSSSATFGIGGGGSSNSFTAIYDTYDQTLRSMSGSGVGVTGSIGISVSGSTNRSYFDFIDLDGDGLPDMVFKDEAHNRLMVAFNLGDTFADPVPWGSSSAVSVDLRTAGQFYNPMTNSWTSATALDDKTPSGAQSPWTIDEEINSSTTFHWNLSGSLGFEFNFYFFIPLFGPVLNPFFGLGFSLSGGSGSTSINSGFQDVEGIGMPDSVINLGGNMVVRQNLSGQDGLVTTITTPEGGEISLSYGRTANTYDDAHSRWVLTQVTHKNWNTAAVASSDAASLPLQTVTVNYSYSGGYYDRADRRFWGFTKVTTTRTDGRSTITTYANKDYYLHGKVVQIVQYDAQGNVLERETNTLNTSAQITVSGAKPSYWVYVTDTLHETVDPSGTGTMTVDTRYAAYDNYGNPTQIDEYQSGSLRNRVKISYQLPSGSLYLASLPTNLEVDGSSGDVLRARTGSYDSLGNLTRQDSQYASGRMLTTTLTWDSYGNLTSESDNAGYQLNYTYDTVLHQLVTGVSDTLGQSTSWTYDYAQGVELSQTDTNGQIISKTYDTFGRMLSVRSPYDTGSVPALAFSYDQSSYPWKAVTQNKVNYDPSDTQTITTVVMADGQGRMLQTKKQSVVTDPATGTPSTGWTVSPWVVYDDEGREWQKGTPSFENSLSRTGVYAVSVRAAFGTDDLYTQTTYDSRDRVTDTRLPDGAYQRTSYVLGQWNSQTAWNITSTDPAGRKKRVWKDPDDLIVAIVQDPNGQAITSRFTYDGIGQLLTAADANGNTTAVVYDQLGRKTSLNSPDSGLVTWEYNSDGDLYRKIDAVLRSKNLAITYSYSQHRLGQITYPDSTQTYTYGTDAGQYNVGRIIAVANDRVTTATTYGKLGETTSTTRTIKTRQAGNPAYVMILGYAWNYLGQMTDVTYPDGETLHYGYDAGGQVTTIAGQHLGVDFAYVNAIGYDEYGQRVRMDLGNGAKTVYTYDPARRWLKEALTTDSMNTVLQDLTYTFDASGDVTTLDNAGAKKATVQNYSYDALDQLTAANGNYANNTYSIGTKTSYAQSFAYDTIGNLTAKISTLNRTPATTQDGLLNYSLSYTYDAAHPHQATHIGTDHYVYDLNGNLTKIIPDWAWTGENTDPKIVIITTQSTGRDVMNQAIGEDRSTTVTTSQTGSRFLTWDWDNRLRAYKDDQTTVMYDYDADGERRLKSIGTTETIYADRMYEVENGSARQLGTVNVYLGDTRLISKVVPLNSPSTGYELQNVYYYHSDHIGNSTLITDYQAREYERLNFTPHGEVWQEDSLDALDKIDYLFTGKQMDAETGWYNFGKRYLDPKTGLWLSADPALGEYLPNAPLTDEDKKHNQSLPGSGGIYNPVNFALYHFAGNNPIRYVDPDGRDPVTSPYYRQNPDGWGSAPVEVDSNKPAVVVIYSGAHNDKGAANGVAYIFPAGATQSDGATTNVSLNQATARVPVVSGGSEGADPTPTGTYKNVPTVPSSQSPQSANILTDANHGGANSTYMPLGITTGAAAGDAMHQANNLATPQTAMTAGCVGVTGDPNSQTANAQTNHENAASIINGQKATFVVKNFLDN